MYADGCYQYDATYRSWPDSQAYCQSLGAQLAEVPDAATNDFLSQTFGPEIFWIGLNDRASEGHFVWPSGKSVTFTDFGDTEPNGNTRENCVNWGFTWNDLPCEWLQGLPSVCQIQL